MEGISFIVRVRDEEATLEESIRSLFALTIPYEIVIILHLCRDSSKEIAERLSRENSNVRVLTYDHPISRAGYENLCTDEDSPHSIVNYYNWCFSQGKLLWRFKWDADFVASPEFIQYLNWIAWGPYPSNCEIFFPAISEDSENTERYLFTGDFRYKKYIFWEILSMTGQTARIFPEKVYIYHKSALKNKKSYWENTPWFLDYSYLQTNPEYLKEAIEVLQRYIKLIEICGPEINGQARASCPDSTNVFYKIKNSYSLLEENGIFPEK